MAAQGHYRVDLSREFDRLVAMRLLALRVLDAAGKWSLLDFLMLMMMAVAFHFTLELHSTPLATGTARRRPCCARRST